MSAAKSRNNARASPASTPSRPSDDALRRVIERRGAARIEELEQENATLQAQLEEALALRDDDDGVHVTSTAGATDETDLATLQKKYYELEERYAELEAKHGRQQVYVERATQKYDAAKISAMQWKAYVDKHIASRKSPNLAPNAAITPAPAPPAMPREISDIDTTPRPDQQAPSARREASGSTHDNQTRRGDGEKLPDAPRAGNETARILPSSTQQSERITSSQTTVDDEPHDQSLQIKQEPSDDDEPIVVGGIGLKRRRGESSSAMANTRRIKQEPESPERLGSREQPVELRSEDYSSPLRKTRTLMRTETSDLDAIHGAFKTPRSRRIRNQHRATSENRAGISVQAPRGLTRNSSSLSEGDATRLPQLPTEQEDLGDGEGRNSQAIVPKAEVTPKANPNTRRKALHQLSPNVPCASKMTRKRRRTSEQDADEVGAIAEDDDEATSQVTPKADNAPPKPHTSTRLDAMLENPTPGRQPLQPRRPPSTNKRTNLRRGPPQPEATNNNQATPSFKRPPGIEKSPPPIDPASEPLRLKPMQHLRPQDFRVNPAFASSTYAFNDPLNRKTKAARRCLPGCIDPACCGEFLEAARSGILPPSSKTDSQVLEATLGPGYAGIVAAYPASERGELLIQARAQEFANEHGRHRKQFERAHSPPGFWRTEMPSTQEEEEDRRKAAQMEKARVEGMWREAMRGDGKGRWKFRDE